MISLDSLNPPQREAVLHDTGPLVVFAGAGSGKTRVITYRIARLIEEGHVRPYRILAVTFTNKAAGEMKERLRGLVGPLADDLWVGTFHAICARLLRLHGALLGLSSSFTIYDDADQQAMVKRILKELEIDEKRYPPKAIAGRINREKQDVRGPREMVGDDPASRIAKEVYAIYEERMRSANALDFGDLIYRMVLGLEENETFRELVAGRFDHVLVDEFQDTNHAQFRVVRALAAGHRNICVVGDDDQSIYGWRGADRRNILDFRHTFPEAAVVKLEQNYRSTGRILRAANEIISRAYDREPKRLFTENPEGQKIVVVATQDERDEAALVVRSVHELRRAGVPLSEIAIFYRVHAQSRVVEEALRRENLPYRVIGGQRFYERTEVKDVLAYLRILVNPGDDVSLLRIINKPARGIGKTTIDRLVAMANEANAPVLEALSRALDANRFSGAAATKLREFVTLVDELQEIAATRGLGELGRELIEKTGYRAMLEQDDSPESDARLQVLGELIGSFMLFERDNPDVSLADYLESITLDTTAEEDAGEDRLTLMTVHAAKGLEFKTVLVLGMEEEGFPYRGLNPWDDPEELEEERRLAYVAITRAEERLVLSYARTRTVFGQMKLRIPSRFLAELPPDDVIRLGEPQRPQGAYRPPTQAEVRPPPPPVDYDGVDYPADGMIRPGMAVRHKVFGQGRVVDVREGFPPKVTVEFRSVGRKTLVASYLEPA